MFSGYIIRNEPILISGNSMHCIECYSQFFSLDCLGPNVLYISDFSH